MISRKTWSIYCGVVRRRRICHCREGAALTATRPVQTILRSSAIVSLGRASRAQWNEGLDTDDYLTRPKEIPVKLGKIKKECKLVTHGARNRKTSDQSSKGEGNTGDMLRISSEGMGEEIGGCKARCEVVDDAPSYSGPPVFSGGQLTKWPVIGHNRQGLENRGR